MTSRTATETTTVPADVRVPRVVHGYPPPAQPAGAIVFAYCGAPMIVRGEFSPVPPLDTCTVCVAVWEQERQRVNRGHR